LFSGQTTFVVAGKVSWNLFPFASAEFVFIAVARVCCHYSSLLRLKGLVP